MVPGPLTSDKNSVTCTQSESKFSFLQRNTKVWNTLRLCQGLASFPRGTRDVSLLSWASFSPHSVLLTQNGLPGPGSSSSCCSGLCFLESPFQRPKRNHIGQLMFSRTLPRLASLWLGSPSRCAPLVQQPRPEGRGTWWDLRAHCPLGWRELTGPRTR